MQRPTAGALLPPNDKKPVNMTDREGKQNSIILKKHLNKFNDPKKFSHYIFNNSDWCR